MKRAQHMTDAQWESAKIAQVAKARSVQADKLTGWPPMPGSPDYRDARFVEAVWLDAERLRLCSSVQAHRAIEHHHAWLERSVRRRREAVDDSALTGIV